MKRSEKLFILLPLFLISLTFASAIACDLKVSMINQDPYPAIPGEYVKIVFQVDGVSNPECWKIQFELLEKYPLIFDPGQNSVITIDSGTYSKDFSSFLIAPYKVRIDSDALDGDNPIEVKYKYGSNKDYETKKFDLNIRNTQAKFEVYVKNYNAKTKELTLEILNIGKEDIKSLAVEISKQENIEIKGPKTNIVGDLDSNEYTTADFEAVPKQGEIFLKLHYTDSINARRIVETSVIFEPEYFEGRVADQKKTSPWIYLFCAVVLFLIIYFSYKKYKKYKKKKELHGRR